MCFNISEIRLNTVNSSSPSAAYMQQWIWSALVQIMASRHSALSHYLNQCLVIVNWTLRHKLQWNLNRNTNIFIYEIFFEIAVCEIAAILSRGRWVNSVWPNDAICQYESWSQSGQLMVCCDSKPISEPVLNYHQRCSVAFTGGYFTINSHEHDP